MAGLRSSRAGLRGLWSCRRRGRGGGFCLRPEGRGGKQQCQRSREADALRPKVEGARKRHPGLCQTSRMHRSNDTARWLGDQRANLRDGPLRAREAEANKKRKKALTVAKKKRNTGRVTRWAMSPVLSSLFSPPPAPGFSVRRRRVVSNSESLFPIRPEHSPNRGVPELAPLEDPGSSRTPNCGADCPPPAAAQDRLPRRPAGRRDA